MAFDAPAVCLLARCASGCPGHSLFFFVLLSFFFSSAHVWGNPLPPPPLNMACVGRRHEKWEGGKRTAETEAYPDGAARVRNQENNEEERSPLAHHQIALISICTVYL